MSGLRFWRRNRGGRHAALPAGSIVPGRTPPPVAEAPVRPDEPVREGVRPADASSAVVPLEVAQSEPAATRVGLVFGDGTHVVLDPDDPKAARFAALAEELNR